MPKEKCMKPLMFIVCCLDFVDFQASQNLIKISNQSCFQIRLIQHLETDTG